MSEILAAHRWVTNSALIADVAMLGYLDGTVLDVTFGHEGGFWKCWRPESLTTSDLYAPADHAWDYTDLPCADASFDAVVFDPDYKLNGTPALPEQDRRYGVDIPKNRKERMGDIRAGALEGFRVCRTHLLVKCQDQVEGGKVRWQTIMVTEAIEAVGGRLVDRFEFLTTPRPQPGDRVQRTARRNYSTLLVFKKNAGTWRDDWEAS